MAQALLILDQDYCLRGREQKSIGVGCHQRVGGSLPLLELLGIALFAPDIQKRELVLNISNHTQKGPGGQVSSQFWLRVGIYRSNYSLRPLGVKTTSGQWNCPPKRLKIFKTGQFKFSSFQWHCLFGHLQILAQLILITCYSTKCRADINHCMLLLSHYHNYSNWLAYVAWIAKYFDSNPREVCSVQIVHVS